MGFQPEVPIPKNVKLTKQYIDDNFENIKKILQEFLNYPDIFLDIITPSYSNFGSFFYQRVFLRACMRYRYVYCVAPRAFSKSFVSIMSGILKCIFLPQTKFFIVAPGKAQGSSIAQEKINEIFQKFPFLEKEIVKYNKGKDYTTLIFKNGSVFDVVANLDSQRGNRRNGGIIDEVRDQDGDMLNQVVLPLMNVSRRDMQGEIDPTEPTQQQIYITSAGDKGTYAYNRLIELSIQQIIAPESTFCFGCDYRVPMQHGLLSKQFIEELKISQTFNENSFAREYLSIWVGGSDESWIKYDVLSKYRTVVNSHQTYKLKTESNEFYYISVDVARTGVLTSIQIFKVTPKEDHYQKTLVNSKSLHSTHFALQSIEIKKLYKIYKPKEICIDTTGLGVGLMDFLVQDQIGEDGVLYEALTTVNDEEYKKYNGIKVIYNLKANSSENSLIHSNCFTQLSSGHVKFLITEQEAKSKLLATKVGSKMHPITRLKKLSPYIETTRLFEEICNLRVKQLSGNTVVEQINKKINKDRFSAFEYGLWRIKVFEDEYKKNKKRKHLDLAKFLMFN